MISTFATQVAGVILGLFIITADSTAHTSDKTTITVDNG